MHVVLIETSGNQHYIFATNKLRENVGASELTYRVTTQWTLEADESLADMWHEDAAELRQKLLDQPPIGKDRPVEVIVATSGKAMLLVEDLETGRQIIRAVTTKALKQAPGVDVCGVISPEFNLDEDELGTVVENVHREIERIRDHRPGIAMRFLRLPVVRDCATSRLPAAEWENEKSNGEPAEARSRLSLTKRNNVQSYNRRMRTLLKRYGIDGSFETSIDKLDMYCDWLAVVHADGNRIGQIFQQFWQISGCREQCKNVGAANRYFITQYRKFSIALDLCTESAFVTALKKLLSRKDQLRSLRRMKDRVGVLPILPIVLGGDDLTVICDGQAALQFTHDFLVEFERLTSLPDLPMGLKDVVPQIANAARHIAKPRLTASAGVAIVKPHYPFSAAYKLSEQLRSSAKTTRRSALDFHVLYDASGSDLDLIRQRLQVDEGKTTWLYTRPYVVGPIDDSEMKPHSWQRLVARVNAILRKDEDGRRLLPNSQLHDLRGGLFLGKSSADARYQLVRQRYFRQGITEFDEPNVETGKSLFFSEKAPNVDGTEKYVFRTGLLDALDAANFWPDDGQDNGNTITEDKR